MRARQWFAVFWRTLCSHLGLNLGFLCSRHPALDQRPWGSFLTVLFRLVRRTTSKTKSYLSLSDHDTARLNGLYMGTDHGQTRSLQQEQSAAACFLTGSKKTVMSNWSFTSLEVHGVAPL